MTSVLIVGASLAGIRCATALRRADFDGEITLVGDETHCPYDRPPLSKQFLSGEWEADRLALVQPTEWDELDITFLPGRRAVGLNVATRTVTLDEGEELSAESIVIATGARPRQLPDADGVGGVHVVRTIDDSASLHADLSSGPKKVVVIGAGFIGAEVAATAHGAGHQVTLVEAAAVPMERGLGPVIGKICGDLHRREGVDLRLSTAVAGLHGDSAVDRVELVDGSMLDADVVVVGIGVVPNTEWLADSALELDPTLGNGVVTNERCEAAPNIYAAGDVACFPNEAFGGERMRIEHWENAVEQGTYVGRRIAGVEADPFAPVPWFWSDQYSYKIQLAGRPLGTDEMQIIDGSVEDDRFATIFGRDGQLTGVFGLNRPRPVMQFRRKIAERCSWDEALEFAAAAAKKPRPSK